MAGEWVERTIEDIADVMGGSTPSTKYPENFGGDVPWLTPKDLSGPHPRYVSRGERNLSRQGLESCSAQMLPPNSILLSSRAPIGYVAIAANPIVTNQGFRSLVVKRGYDHEFLYYWLSANVEELERHASGSTFKELSGTSLKKILLRVPVELSEQRAIAHILGTLDDKIELNRRMSATLEAMARALFKSWFVDFDPVRAKMQGRDPGLPNHIAALFPDRLVETEHSEVPEGWSVGQLGDIAEHLRRSIRPEEIELVTPYIALEHMPKRCIALSDWGTADGLESNKFEFKRGEILFGKLRPYFHKVGIAPVDGVCSTDIVVLQPSEPEWSSFVALVASSIEFVAFTDQGSTGTKMPRTSWSEMSRYAVAMPESEVAACFDRIIRPYLDEIVSSVHESRTLAALRDTLLPKLISGELRVEDAGKAVEAVL